MKPSPAQTVNKSFGGRAELVAKLVPMVDDLRSEGEDGLRSRLMALSNKKLLRLYKTEQKVRERYGDRDALVEQLVVRRKKAGLSADDAYRNKLEGFSKGQLLDEMRVKPPERAAKQTPEQRLASKRGKKQRERALSKLKG